MKRALALAVTLLLLSAGLGRAESAWTADSWAAVRSALAGDAPDPVPAGLRIAADVPAAPENEEQGFTVLLMSTDAADMAHNFGRTDLLLLCRVELAGGDIRLLSLPEEALVSLPGLPGPVMLRHVNCFGGPPLLLQTVNAYLNAGASRYCAVNEDAFRLIVDALGGVTLTLTEGEGQAMGLRAGESRLTGDAALRYVRLRRQGDGSVRARKLMEAIAGQLTGPGGSQSIYRLMDLLLPLVDTNLTTKNLVDAAAGLLDRPEGAAFAAASLWAGADGGLDEAVREACRAFFAKEDGK